MSFPKKFTKAYPEGQEPKTFIKSHGTGALLKIVEYRLLKRVGSNCMYKLDKIIR